LTKFRDVKPAADGQVAEERPFQTMKRPRFGWMTSGQARVTLGRRFPRRNRV